MKHLIPLIALIASTTPCFAQPTGDYDYYRMFPPKPGAFSAQRHFGFAHFAPQASDSSWLKSRAGNTVFRITDVVTTQDSITIQLQSASGARQQIRGVIRGDTIRGRLLRDTTTLSMAWLIRRKTPPAFERPYSPWPGGVSKPMYAVQTDSAVPMKTRDGITLMSFVARPVGEGPFPIVMERTPYLRMNHGPAPQFWASRGYIYVIQDVRGRGGSQGVYLHNHKQMEDGYDAVEWAAALPHSNGKVGMIGGSNPGEYAWYAAAAQPPHLAAIAPTVATADPEWVMPYIDMIFSPASNLPWTCLVQGHAMHDISKIDVGATMLHLPVADLAKRAGCTDQAFWDLWIERAEDYAYWQPFKVENRLRNVRVPVLGLTGWYDDARGAIRQYARLDSLPNHPYQRLLVSAGAHKGIDYVYGNFGPQARADYTRMQLIWFDRFLKGIANGVDSGPPIDLFIMGDNTWRKEAEWPLKRTQWTKYFLRSGGRLSATSPGSEPADAYTYDPADPTPYLIDGRELELNANEDYAAVHRARKDLVLYETETLTRDLEITGPVSASIWAVSNAKDTDWNVMLLDVHPDGQVRRLVDGVTRARFRNGFGKPALLTPGQPYRYDIDLWWTGIVIPKGHKLRVAIASAGFPKYDRNLNTGRNNEKDTRYVSAQQQILHDAEHPSYVLLPVIPR